MKFLKKKSKVITKFKSRKAKTKKIIILILSRLGALIFHEDYAIFTLPLIFFPIFLFKYLLFDIRAIVTVAALVLFPAIILDIIYYANKIDSNLETEEKNLKPKLPDILFQKLKKSYLQSKTSFDLFLVISF